jgi:RimJ/RimL family protein N-acetyltransferase
MPTVYRIETPRLVLRPLGPMDQAMNADAVGSSLAHLRPWMPWARDEPSSRLVRIERLRQHRANFDLGMDFIYGAFDRDERVQIGAAGLHPRVGPAALEIGYWVRASHVRQGLAMEAAGALARVALQTQHARRVEIHCDPNNVASAAVARRLGFTHDGTLRRRDTTVDGRPRDTMVWSLFAEELGRSPALAIPIAMFDAGGAPIHVRDDGTLDLSGCLEEVPFPGP